MIGKTLDNRYEIVSLIGEGGMAAVYQARDHLLHRDVAIKILHDHLVSNPEIRMRFEREASFIAKLEHPNIVKIFDYGARDQAYIVSEWIRGKNFHVLQTEHFARHGQVLPYVVTVLICEQIAAALGVAHKNSVVHRDIKPDNVLISAIEGTVKLTDFGIAKNLLQVPVTQVGHFLGSPGYAAPEQVLGQAVDFRADIYSLGVILYEALVGKLPFSGLQSAQVMLKIVQGEYTQLSQENPNIPKLLVQVVERAMQSERERRYASCFEMQNDLRSFLKNFGIQDCRSALQFYLSQPQQFFKKHVFLDSPHLTQTVVHAPYVSRLRKLLPAFIVLIVFTAGGLFYYWNSGLKIDNVSLIKMTALQITTTSSIALKIGDEFSINVEPRVPQLLNLPQGTYNIEIKDKVSHKEKAMRMVLNKPKQILNIRF